MRRRTACRLPTPGLPIQLKISFEATPGADHLVVDHVGGHAGERQVAPALPDDLVARREADQVRESLDRDGVAVAHELAHGVLHRRDLRLRMLIRTTHPSHRERGHARCLRAAGFDLGDRVLEDLERTRAWSSRNTSGGRDADRVVAAPQRQQPAPERGLLHRRGPVVVGEGEPDPQRPAPHLGDDRVTLARCSRMPARKTSPTADAFAIRPSSSITSRVASAAAHGIGEPP